MTMKMKRGFLAAAVLGLVAAATPSAQELPLERLTLPDGFHIEVYASGVKNARQMALTPDGTLFVGSHGAGNVYAVVDDDDDFRADRVVTIATALSMPSGLAFRDGSLYVGAVSRILRFDDIESRLDNPPEPVVITDGLPAERHHGWKYLGFGPDGMLYAPVGGPCNICDRTDEDPRYATILRMNPDGSGEEIFAHGVRNSVGFDWQPGTNGPCNICDRTDEDPRYATILRMNPDGSGEEIFAHGVRNSVGFDWQPGTNDPGSPTTGATGSVTAYHPTP